MDEVGVAKAAVVQASTCHGYDNSYLADSIARFPGRLTEHALKLLDKQHGGAAAAGSL